MNPIDRLKWSTGRLRATLAHLEAAVSTRPASEATLRHRCRACWRQLDVHYRCEEHLISSCRATLATRMPQELREAEHERRYLVQLLHRISRLMLHKHVHSEHVVRAAFSRVAARLHRHMDEEEAAMIPVIQGILSEQHTSRCCCRCGTPASGTLGALS